MNYKVKTIPKFDKELKRLVKKYPSLKNEFLELIQLLKDNPEFGIPLGNYCFKSDWLLRPKIRVNLAAPG